MIRPSSPIVGWIGWIGVTCILIAYILLNFGIFTAMHGGYILLNLFGSLAILFEATLKRDYPPAFLNAVWAVVACIGLINWLI